VLNYTKGIAATGGFSPVERGAMKKSAKRETEMGLQSNSENESEVGGCFWEWGEGVGRDFLDD